MSQTTNHKIHEVAHAIYSVARNPHVLIATTVLISLIVLLFSPILITLPRNAFLSALTEQLVVSEINPFRSGIGENTLTVNPLLTAAAQAKADDMIARDYFSHLGPDGELPWEFMTNVGYTYSGAGENLAIDFSDPIALVTAWINSPSHRKNIANGLFSDIGIGIASGDFEGRNTNVVVMFVGREYTPTVAAVTNPVPPPTPTPEPVPIPTPEPTPEPIPETIPTQEPEQVPAPVTVPTPETIQTPEAIPTQEPVTELTVPAPEEAFVVITSRAEESIISPVATSAAPTSQQKFAAYLLNTALMLRYILTAFLFVALFAWSILMLLPKMNPNLRHAHPTLHIVLLAFLWLPSILG